ncbi:MAG: alpha/beta fold hydrolase [Sneathiella sp.]|nr:alpha/beta fold hydrolase [Sneathiella sp.]
MVKKLITSIGISAFIFFGLAIGLIFSQDLMDLSELEDVSGGKGLDFESQTGAPEDLPPRMKYSARDGTQLDYRYYESSTPTEKLLVLVHGSGWHSQQFVRMAKFIADQGVAHVVTPDLRGHGYTPVKRGDISYIGQFEDDLADLIESFKKTHPTKTVILGGHSSGGGLVVRFAGGDHSAMVDAYLLMAPFLKYNAPTTRENSGGWARPLTRRIIGLSLLNSVGIKILNGLPVIQFNMPAMIRNGPLGETATLNYSYRLNTAYAPRSDFEADLAALTQPFFLLAGSADEAFFADKYEEVISAQTSSGLYEILPGLSHLQIVQDEAAHYLIADWIEQLKS